MRRTTSVGKYRCNTRDRPNMVAALMGAVRTHSIGRIGHALQDIGMEFCRNR